MEKFTNVFLQLPAAIFIELANGYAFRHDGQWSPYRCIILTKKNYSEKQIKKYNKNFTVLR